MLTTIAFMIGNFTANLVLILAYVILGATIRALCRSGLLNGQKDLRM